LSRSKQPNSFQLSSIHITFRAEGLDCAISHLYSNAAIIGSLRVY